jgi:cysteine desulfurase
MQTGGGQESGLRAGTHNIPYIIGLAEAFHLAQSELVQRSAYVIPLRDRLIGKILEEVPNSQLTGHPEERLPNHASFVFKNIDGNNLLIALDMEGFACSSGSACKTGYPEPSEVLTALGLSKEWALGSLRVTMGNISTSSEIDAFLKITPEIIARMRESG